MHDSLSNHVAVPVESPSLAPAPTPPSNARRLDTYVKQAQETRQEPKKMHRGIQESNN